MIDNTDGLTPSEKASGYYTGLRYFLRTDNAVLGYGPWTEVTPRDWKRAERAAGFRPHGGGDGFATGGFGGGRTGVSGTQASMKLMAGPVSRLNYETLLRDIGEWKTPTTNRPEGIINDDMLNRPWWWIDQGGLDEAEESTPGLLVAWANRLIATGDDNKRRAAAHLMDVLDDMERIRKEDEVQS